jgi:hypothetical protein
MRMIINSTKAASAMRRNLIEMCCVAMLAASPLYAAGGGYWSGIAEEVCAEITKAESLAKAGKGSEAKEAIVTAYFGVFEEKKMEISERANLGSSHTADIEEMFNGLRKAVGKAGNGDVPSMAEKLRKALREDGKALDVGKVKPDGLEVSK